MANWRRAMAMVWTYAPGLDFMATSGNSAIAFGGRFKWVDRPANDNGRKEALIDG